jgi:multimeric flavodoxin WrbA
MTILGFSSSPVRSGNVDRMVKVLLKLSGKEVEFVNLNNLDYGPCMACPRLCASDNICKLDDGLRPYYEKIIDSDALVLGSPSYFGGANSAMVMFLERLWSLRHNRYPIAGKPFVAVSSAGFRNPESPIEAMKRRMIAYRAEYIGGVAHLSGIAPCFVCGDGLTCRVGSFWTTQGEEGQERLKVGRGLFGRWEDSSEISQEIEVLGRKLAAL